MDVMPQVKGQLVGLGFLLSQVSSKVQTQAVNLPSSTFYRQVTSPIVKKAFCF